MIILSNCLSDTPDEGCLKVANSLIKRIKAAVPDTTVLSYERKSSLTDNFFRLNKLLLNKSLALFLKQKGEQVLYVPFPARPVATALRTFILSAMCPCGLRVLSTMNVEMGTFAKDLYKLSRAHFFVLSEEVAALYAGVVGQDRVTRIKTGVDTRKFTPASRDRQRQLKEMHGFDPEKKMVLHVGHLNAGRNIEQLLKINGDYQVVLVASTETKSEQDSVLRKRLEEAGNIRIMDEYIPRIQEIYQMADVYFFPVQQAGHCIDVPLSCLEAAACNKPVVTTAYGEMRELIGEKGFYPIDSFEEVRLNRVIQDAVSNENPGSRESVLEYDWDQAVNRILSM